MIHEAPITTVDPADCVAPPSGERVSCGVCDKVVGGGQVVNDGARFDHAEQCYALKRLAYCDHCDHWMVWSEASNLAGQPTGTVISGPSYITARKQVESLLRRHPEAAGVI